MSGIPLMPAAFALFGEMQGLAVDAFNIELSEPLVLDIAVVHGRLVERLESLLAITAKPGSRELKYFKKG